jgi:hypothetical protein
MEFSCLHMKDTTIHKSFPKCITRPECDCFNDLQNIVNSDDLNLYINQSINLLIFNKNASQIRITCKSDLYGEDSNYHFEIINSLQKEALRKYFQKIKNATSTFITNSLQSTNIYTTLD